MFVRKLHDALAQRGTDTWVDWQGFPLTADFLQEIYAAIDSADVFVFVISPDSVSSESCRLEVAHASDRNKRLVPVVHRNVDDKAVPAELAHLNWIFFRDQDDFEKAFQSLIEAIDIDLDWLHAHTRLLTRALEWQRVAYHQSLLLRGDDLRQTEASVRDALSKQPPTSALQLEYLQASREAAAIQRSRRRVRLASIAVGAISALGFVPTVLRLPDYATDAFGVGLRLAADVAIPIFNGVGAAPAFGLASLGALSLEQRRVGSTLWWRSAAVLATAVGAVVLGTIAGVEVDLAALAMAWQRLPWGLLTAGLVTAALQSLVFEGVVLNVRRVRRAFLAVEQAGTAAVDAAPAASTRRLGMALGILGGVDLGVALSFSTGLLPMSLPTRVGLAAPLALGTGGLLAVASNRAAQSALARWSKVERGSAVLRPAVVSAVAGVDGSATAFALGVLATAGQPPLAESWGIGIGGGQFLAAALIGSALAAALTPRVPDGPRPGQRVGRAAERSVFETAEASPEARSRQPALAPAIAERATRVFISYSRRDSAFVHRLHDALIQRQLETWVDWEGIPLTADFLQEIYAAIESSDVFLFVISPDSVASQVCGLEIAHASEHRKRLVPVVQRDVEGDAVPEPLRRLNWIFCREGDDFDRAVDQVSQAIALDLDWLHAHTHLLTRAVDWERKLRHESLLLSGRALREAEVAFARAHRATDPPATPLQLEYLRQSWTRATHGQARARAWLTSLGFGALCGALVGLPMARPGLTALSLAGSVVPAVVIGALMCAALVFGALRAERRRGQLSDAERWLPVALAVLVGALAGSTSVLFTRVFLANYPELRPPLERPVGSLAASLIAAAVAVTIVSFVVLPHRRLGPFQADDQLAAGLEAMRRRSLKRLLIGLVVLATLELGWSTWSQLIPVPVLLAAFVLAGGCLGMATRMPGVRHARLAAPVVSVVAGGVFGVGVCAVVLPLVRLPVFGAPNILNALASVAAAGVAAAADVTLEPRLPAPAFGVANTAPTRGGPEMAVGGICAGALLVCGLVIALTPEGAANLLPPFRPLRADDALAAVLSWQDVQQLFPGQDWWPAGIDLEAPPFRGNPETSSPGWRFSAGQSYVLVGSQPREFIIARVDLYGDPGHAEAAFAHLLGQADQGLPVTPGPPLGDEQRYAVSSGTPAGYTGSVRFRLGPAIVSVQRGSGDPVLASPEALASVSQVFLPRVQALVDGQLHAAPLSSDLARVLPPAAEESGLVLGSAVRPIEAYAVLSVGDDPRPLLQKLREDGATDWAERQYALPLHQDHRLDAAALSFRDAAAAADFTDYDTAPQKASSDVAKLDPGKTGPHAVFFKFQDGSYNLEFAKGAIGAQVACGSAYGTTSTACETEVRNLAQAWYAALP
jgi:TIR domain